MSAELDDMDEVWEIEIAPAPIHAQPATRQTLLDLFEGDDQDADDWRWGINAARDVDLPDVEADPDGYWSFVCCAAVTDDDLRQLLAHGQPGVDDSPPDAVLAAARKALTERDVPEAWHTAMMFIAANRGSL